MPRSVRIMLLFQVLSGAFTTPLVDDQGSTDIFLHSSSVNI